MAMMIDTHAHYDDPVFENDLDDVLEQSRAAGVSHVINAGTTAKAFDRIMNLTRRYDMVYTAIGVHPECVIEPHENLVEQLRALSADPKVVAIGEIGLDYHYDSPAPDASEEEKALALSWDHGSAPVNWPPRNVQQEVFRAQIAFAKEAHLPIVVHSRDAAEDTLRVLRETNAGETGCDMHCYGYSKESARDFLNLGCYLGIGGVSTFKNGRKLKEVLEYAPLDRLLLETDAPYLTPEPHRGKRNASLYLPYVVNAIAQIKGISAEEVMEQTTQNARRLFAKLPQD